MAIHFRQRPAQATRVASLLFVAVPGAAGISLSAIAAARPSAGTRLWLRVNGAEIRPKRPCYRRRRNGASLRRMSPGDAKRDYLITTIMTDMILIAKEAEDKKSAMSATDDFKRSFQFSRSRSWYGSPD